MFGIIHAADADFIYSRTPSGNPAFTPVDIHIQGAFGTDFCGNWDSYRILLLGGSPGLISNFVNHSLGDLVNDMIQFDPAPGSTYYVQMQCYSHTTGLLSGNINLEGPISFVASVPTIINNTAIVGSVNRIFSQYLAVSGGLYPYTFMVTSGSLPPGLSLDVNTGLISGTPTASGNFSTTIQVIDSNSVSNAQNFNFIIAPEYTSFAYSRTPSSNPAVPPIDIHIRGVFGLDVCGTQWDSYRILLIGSSPALISNFVSHALGDLADDTIQFNPIPGTSYEVKMQCYSHTTGLLSGNINLESYFQVAQLSISTFSLLDGDSGTPYSQTLSTTGTNLPLTWGIASGALPPGLSLNSLTGEISGIPTTPGTYDFTIQVTDANSQSDTQDLSIAVNAVPTITTASLSAATIGGDYSKTLLVTGGTSPLNWSIASGSLPIGLSLGSTTGIISGTPTAAGISNFIVQVTDAYSVTDTQALYISVNVPPAITRNNLPSVKLWHHYSQTVTASGGTTPLTWVVASGALPPGLSISSATGVISGTPTTIGTYIFTLRVVDANNVNSTKKLSIQVKP